MTPGLTYRLTHARKGVFVARVLAIEPTKPGDPDPHFVRVEIDTTEGGPHERLANAPWRDPATGKKHRSPPKTEKLLRPSLILSAEEV